VETFTTVKGLRAALSVVRARTPVALVPTMGALHDGHLALVRAARREAAVVVVSIFVNPLQFGPGEDFARYPRDLPRDEALLQEEEVDFVFAPPVSELYHEDAATVVEVGGLSTVLEGAVRPGHFRGVTTVVAKLLHVVQPDKVYFGQKDWQQAMIVRRMLRDLLWPVTQRVLPTVRAPDGLALSSRNAYLTEEERRRAVVLPRALAAGCQALAAGEREPEAVEAAMTAAFAREPAFQVDYAVAVAADGLERLPRLEGEVLLAAAGRLGGTRLLDNAVVQVLPEGVRDGGDEDGWTFRPL
jgi:pantoate--beta-alanine ligase